MRQRTFREDSPFDLKVCITGFAHGVTHFNGTRGGANVLYIHVNFKSFQVKAQEVMRLQLSDKQLLKGSRCPSNNHHTSTSPVQADSKAPNTVQMGRHRRHIYQRGIESSLVKQFKSSFLQSYPRSLKSLSAKQESTRWPSQTPKHSHHGLKQHPPLSGMLGGVRGRAWGRRFRGYQT